MGKGVWLVEGERTSEEGFDDGSWRGDLGDDGGGKGPIAVVMWEASDSIGDLD
jgi:hypothetical protein